MQIESRKDKSQHWETAYEVPKPFCMRLIKACDVISFLHFCSQSVSDEEITAYDEEAVSMVEQLSGPNWLNIFACASF